MTLHCTPEISQAWSDALLAARLLAAFARGRPADRAGGPVLSGVHVRARQGPVLDVWLSVLREQAADAPMVRFSSTVESVRLEGGLDLAATIDAGRPVLDTGLLERARGGFAVLAMAERVEDAAAAAIARALDGDSVALVALDEGCEPDEALRASLADRLALRLDLSSIPISQAVVAPAVPLPCAWTLPAMPDELPIAFAQVAEAAGSGSMRLALSLGRVATAIAMLEASPQVKPAHAGAAIRLVLGLAGLQAPEQQEETQPRPEEAPDPRDDGARDDAPPADASDLDETGDILVEAVRARLPELAVFFRHDRRKAGRGGQAGKAGGKADDGARGRRIGVSRRPTSASPRPDAVATLRAAAPWQKLRGRDAGPGAALVVRKSDFRYRRCRQPRQSTTIFAVDASGSTALDRLGEAKGAVELLLADCYVRRDEVALIAFRGDSAELLLEPTRSLVRAKRSLGGLPGGGATPLASALMKSLELACGVRRKGHSPLVVLMTDGSGNVALDGTRDRAAAARDTEAAARKFAMQDLEAIVIDIARREREETRQLALAMGADYCRLPRADAAAVSAIVSAHLRAG